MKLKFLTGISLFALSIPAYAQSLPTEKLNEYFDILEKQNKFMGDIAISQNDRVVYTKTTGFQNIESAIKADSKTLYQIGSISKTFTAVLVFKAIEEKKLALDTKLSTFFPSVENAEKITIKNLLNHSSGIFNLTDDPKYLTWHSKEISQQELLGKIAGAESQFEPGTEFSYSNSNYVLLSLILEKVFGMSYSRLLDKHISAPLQLKNTSFGKANLKNLAQSYTFSGTWKHHPETHYTVPLGAGGIVSTAGDLLTFVNGLTHEKILTKQSLDQMKNFNERYGLGLFKFPFKDHSGIGHDGAIDGFRSIVTTFEKEKVSVAILSNASNYQLDLINKTVLNAVFIGDIEIPEFKTISFTKPELSKLTGVYSNTNLPFKITITEENLILSAQATGQAAFPLEAIEKNIFTFDRAGIKLTFDPDKNTMQLKQSGMEIELKKED